MNKLIIWGVGGHAKVVLDVVRATGVFQDIVFVDDAFPRVGQVFRDCPIAGDRCRLVSLIERGYRSLLVAVGDNKARRECYIQALARGFGGATAVHPSAVVSPSASIDPGTIIMPNVVINAGARIGANCIINTGAIVEHDCRIGDHVHLGPRVALGGGVVVESSAQLGIGAVALPFSKVGEGAVVGAGAVVLDTVASGVTAVGVPARVIRTHQQLDR